LAIRLVPTYILPAKDIRLLGKFQPDSFKTCVETDGIDSSSHADQNIYILYGVGNVSFTALQTSDWNHYTLCGGIRTVHFDWGLLTTVFLPHKRNDISYNAFLELTIIFNWPPGAVTFWGVTEISSVEIQFNSNFAHTGRLAKKGITQKNYIASFCLSFLINFAVTCC